MKECKPQFLELDFLPISALQHLIFCKRQAALIHLEGLWAENQFTVQGRHLHGKAHAGRGESRAGVRIARALQLRSLKLGLYGVADVVEFAAGGAPLPVEYKRGRPKKNGADRVQLCAQGLCLEEMLDTAIPQGALYYGKLRRRVPVPFDEDLRQLTRQTIADLHQLLASGRTPPARREKKCDRCSLFNLCMPEVLQGCESASRYLRRSLIAQMLPSSTSNQQLTTGN